MRGVVQAPTGVHRGVTPIRTDQLRHRVSGNQLVGKAQIRSFHAWNMGTFN